MALSQCRRCLMGPDEIPKKIYSVRLSRMAARLASLYGDGNLSEGVRRLIHRHAKKWNGEERRHDER